MELGIADILNCIITILTLTNFIMLMLVARKMKKKDIHENIYVDMGKHSNDEIYQDINSIIYFFIMNYIRTVNR